MRFQGRFWIFFRKALVLVAGVGLIIGLIRPFGGSSDRLPAGTKLPASTLPNLTDEGKPFALASLQGKAVLINFWAPW